MRIGIDLGGTKIEAIALAHTATGASATLLRHRVPTPTGDYAGILNAIAGLVALMESETGQTGTVGIATPGAISPSTGFLKNSNSTVLNGKALDRDLEARLGRPIRMENDANCLALSEAVDGAAATARVVFGVILGTGVGGGVVINRQVHDGRNRIAGEWGHNPLPWARADELPGPGCYCGKVGCIETFLSGAGLTRDYRVRSGHQKTAVAVAEAGAAGDPLANECLKLYQDRLARSLASIINVLDPDAIVLGGGLSNLTCLYPALPALLTSYTFSADAGTPIVRAMHGDSSGVRGAAWLWPISTSTQP
ncbi:MAG: ROK family protein [Terriglobales bacterium]